MKCWTMNLRKCKNWEALCFDYNGFPSSIEFRNILFFYQIISIIIVVVSYKHEASVFLLFWYTWNWKFLVIFLIQNLLSFLSKAIHQNMCSGRINKKNQVGREIKKCILLWKKKEIHVFG